MYFRFKKRRKGVIMKALREVATKEVPMVDMDMVEYEDMEEVEEYHPLVLTMDIYAMYRYFSLNHALFVGTYIVLNMS
jgi:hypothetical protein